MKILIADKDEALLKMVTANLKANGLKVIAVQDAVQTWLSVLREVPDLVLVDSSMPGGGGLSVVRSIKRSSKTSHIPVFLMAEPGEKDAAEKARECGAEAVLRKPLNIVEVLKIAEDLTRGEFEAITKQILPEPARFEGPKMKILVADDDPGTRHALTALLKKWEYEVVTTKTGEETLRVLEAKDGPQLAIIDWEMPGKMQGIDVVRAVRKTKRDSYIYIVLLTARSFRDHLIEGLEAGADDYMVKPFDSRELRLRANAGRRIIQLQEELMEAKGHQQTPQLLSA